MNKKGYLITGGFLMGAILIFLLIIFLLYSGGGFVASSALNQIPLPVWVLIGIILFFKLIGGKK